MQLSLNMLERLSDAVAQNLNQEAQIFDEHHEKAGTLTDGTYLLNAPNDPYQCRLRQQPIPRMWSVELRATDTWSIDDPDIAAAKTEQDLEHILQARSYWMALGLRHILHEHRKEHANGLGRNVFLLREHMPHACEALDVMSFEIEPKDHMYACTLYMRVVLAVWPFWAIQVNPSDDLPSLTNKPTSSRPRFVLPEGPKHLFR